MATRQANRARRRARAISGKKHPVSRTSRRRVAAKRASAPRISRSRLRMLKDDLDRARDVVSETVDTFWITPEHDIREVLARTQHKIGRVTKTLTRA
jgi:hypothetical protein